MWELIGLIAYLAFWGAVSWGISYLGSKWFGPEVDEDAKPAALSPQSTGWNPFSTQQEGIPEPRAYGKNMHHGNILAKWTKASGHRETLFIIIEHTAGPTKGIIVGELYINDQLVSNLNHPSKGPVVVQERLGTMDQTCMTGFEKQKFEYAQNIHLLEDAYHTFITPNDFVDDIEWTFWFPNGLMYVHGDGGNDYGLAHLKIYGREYDVGAGWTEIVNEQIVGASFNPRYFPFTASVEGFNMVAGTQYEFKCARTDEPAGATSGPNDMYLKSIRTVRDSAYKRPGKALVGIKAVATSKLCGRLDVKCIREDRIVDTYNGEAWTLQYSNNRAWVVWDILTQPVIDGNGIGTPYTIYRYEGIDPATLDLEFFYNWSLFCAEQIADGDGGLEPRSACNVILDTFDDVWSVACRIAGVGRAHLYWRGDKLSGWVDDVVTTPTDLVTMDSTMAKTWKNNWATDAESAKVVEVLFKDSKQGYEKTPVEAGRLDVTGYQNIIGVEGTGLTTRGAAAHLAYYMVERNRLIRNKNSFRVHKDGFRYHLGEVIRLQSRPANWGHAFRVVSSTVDTVTVDRDAAGEVNVDDVLHIRSWDTVTEQTVTDSYVVDTVVANVITVTMNWDVTPVKGNLVAVGPEGDIKLRRIIEIKPTVDNYFNVTVETYDAALFDADDVDPDNPNVNYLWPGPASVVNSEITRQQLNDIVSQSIKPSPNIDVPWPSNLNWYGDEVDTVSWEATTSGFDITFRYAGTTHVVAADSTTLKYVYWNPASPTVFLKTNVLATALGAGCWMMCINEDGVAHTTNPQQLIHGGLIQAGTITADYAQLATLCVLEANIGNLAVTSAKIGNLAVTSGKIGNLAVTSAKIGNLQVKSANIENLTVGTGKIADGAVTTTKMDYTNGSIALTDSWQTIADVTLTLTGKDVQISFSCFLTGTGGVNLKLLRVSSIVWSRNNVTMGDFSRTVCDIAPSAGSTLYRLQGQRTVLSPTAAERSLAVVEFKK